MATDPPEPVVCVYTVRLSYSMSGGGCVVAWGGVVVGADVVGVPMPTLSAVGGCPGDGWAGCRPGVGQLSRGAIAISDGGGIVMGVGSVGGPRV